MLDFISVLSSTSLATTGIQSIGGLHLLFVIILFGAVGIGGTIFWLIYSYAYLFGSNPSYYKLKYYLPVSLGLVFIIIYFLGLIDEVLAYLFVPILLFLITIFATVIREKRIKKLDRPTDNS